MSEREKRREQADPTGGDPLVLDGLDALDLELFGPDPVDRMQATGEPGPCHAASSETEGEISLCDGFVDPGTAVERDGEPGPSLTDPILDFDEEEFLP